VSTGLKTVLGRELITDDEVAIFELVKNSFDAGAKHANGQEERATGGDPDGVIRSETAGAMTQWICG
jgi:hypothetical protein